MTSPLRLAIGLTVLALPLAEIALLIKMGGLLGFWPVFAIVMLTAVAGSLVIKEAGLSAVSRMFAQVQAGASPVRSMLDQFLSFTAGVLLILPGLLGDCAGALLLIPAVRALVLKSFASLFIFEHVTAKHEETHAQGDFKQRSDAKDKVTIIEGEYERLDDDASPK